MPDNTNLQPPNFAPMEPTYPMLEELCQVGTSVGGNVYNGFIMQFVPPLSMRPRTACYVWEPNGIVLQPGIYECRLISSYLSLPLYATTCCVGVSSSAQP